MTARSSVSMVTKRAPAKRTSTRKTAAKKPAVRRAPRAKKLKRTFWDDLADIGRRIPDEELAKLPTDLAFNFDHYAHGSPRQEPRQE